MRSILILLASVSVVGCASTSMTKLSSKVYQAKPESCGIKVLSQKPTTNYEEVALLNARGGQSIFEGKSVADLLPGMMKKACLAGGDAIIIKDAKEGGYNFVGPADRASASATVIKFIQ